MEYQRRLAQATSQSMAIPYFRGEYYNALQKWLREVSIDVSFDFRRWRKHQSPWRNVKLWEPKLFLRSDNIRRLLFPDLTAVCVASVSICYYNAFAATWFDTGMLYLPFECFSLTSFALGLLVTFKTQTSYARFIEGRNLWGLTINESRQLTSRIMARVPGFGGNPENFIVQDAKQHAVKLVRSFPVTLKYHLTEDGCNKYLAIRPDSRDPEAQRIQEAQLKDALLTAIKAELSQIWDMQNEDERRFVERMTASEVSNRPLHVLHEISIINARVFANPKLGCLDHMAANEMDNSLRIFQNILGACEKILRTPIYSPYTKFTCRFLTVWCTTLPLALYPLLGLGTVPASITISFFMLGIEDIGSRVEQPFNVMPLWQYCQTVDTSCVQIVRATEQHLQRQAISLEYEDDAGSFDFDGIQSEQLRSWCNPLDDYEMSSLSSLSTLSSINLKE